MNPKVQILVNFTLFMLVSIFSFSQGVLISEEENAVTEASAILEIQSKEKGFLPPRMSTIEREAIVNAANGLVVYDTDEETLYLFDGTEWKALSTQSSKWLSSGQDIYRNGGNVGIGISSPVSLLHSLGTGIGEGNVVFEGQFKSGNHGNLAFQGSGTRMMWYPDKAAFRVGFVSENNWDMDSIGIFSMAFGYNTKASGDRSTAFGRSTSATGAYSTSLGRVSTALGNTSIAAGHFTTSASFAESVFGSYNTLYSPLGGTSLWNPADRLFVIGKGTSPTNRSDALVVLKSGNVGIGTSEPEAELHVAGNFRLEDGTQSAGKILMSDSEGNASWADLDLFGNNTITVDASGGGNYLTISEALNAVNPTQENPVTILIKPGNYFEAVELKSYITLRGTDPENVIISGWADAMPGLNGYTYVALLNSVTNVKLINLTVRSNEDGIVPDFGVYMLNSQAHFDNVSILGDWNGILPLNYGISAHNSDIQFINSKAIELLESAFILENSSADIMSSKLAASVYNVHVQNNSILELRNSNINAGTGVEIDNGGKATITGNTFIDNAYAVQNNGHVLMTGNVIKNSSLRGVANNNNANITGNFFYDCVEQAISDNSTGNTTITGNYIENSSFAGQPAMTIFNSDVLLSSNVFHNNTHGDISTGNQIPWLIGNKGTVINSIPVGIMAGIDDMRIERSGENMYLNLPGSGKVGVKTVNPRGTLNISQNSGVTNSSTIDDYPLMISYPSNANNNETGLAFRISSQQNIDQTPGAAITHLRAGNGSVGDLLFKTKPSGDFDPLFERMRITNIGNVGIGTGTPAALLHTSGTGTGEGNVLFVGQRKPSSPGPAPIQGSGTRMMWYPDKAAFRVGRVNGSNWNTDSIGHHSFASGYNTKALEDYSTAMGISTQATAFSSTAMGSGTQATGSYSTAIGYNTQATGPISTAIGSETQATGPNSTAMGSGTRATGNSSTAMGQGTLARSGYETVVGRYNTDYIPLSSLSWNSNDRLFVIGNGTATDSRSDAMVVLKNGNTGLGTSTPDERLHVNGNIHVSGGNRTIFNRSNNSLQLGTNNTARLHITNTGNIGIGLTSPNELLQVNGNIHVSGGNRTIFNRSNNSLAFGTNNIERIRITSGGNIGIGTDAPDASLHIERTSSSSTPQMIVHNSSGSGFARLRLTNQAHSNHWDVAIGGDNNMMDFWQSGGTGSVLALRGDAPNIGVGIRTTNPAFTLHVNGEAGKPGGGSWSNASDVRLKSNVQDLRGSLENLLKLRGVSFIYNDPEAIHELPGERIGMIAQEVAEVFPDWVNEANDGYLRLTFRGFEALVVEALRELRREKDEEITSLNMQLQELKTQNQALEERLSSIERLLTGLSNKDTAMAEND
jgi:hypothetical protein